jgi:hypothetical protein
LEDLANGKLRVRLQVRYTEDDSGRWYEVKNAQVVVSESARMSQPSTDEPATSANDQPLDEADTDSQQ